MGLDFLEGAGEGQRGCGVTRQMRFDRFGVASDKLPKFDGDGDHHLSVPVQGHGWALASGLRLEQSLEIQRVSLDCLDRRFGQDTASLCSLLKRGVASASACRDDEGLTRAGRGERKTERPSRRRSQAPAGLGRPRRRSSPR